MPACENMPQNRYADSFWGEDLTSTAGYDALVKRNKDGKRMCADLEDYLKKRSKADNDYSKALSELTKNFKEKNQLGVMESTFNNLRTELENRARHFNDAASFFQQQAEKLKKFKEDQMNRRKALEDTLNKAQKSKLLQWHKTKQMEKSYVNRWREKDAAERSYKEIQTQQVPPKDVDKARNKASKTQDEAEKSDAAYRGAVLVLEDCRVAWEKEMSDACNSIQTLDEERLSFLREEIWTTVNEDSKLALEIDNGCERVREILEQCDIVSDIQAFIQEAGTGEDRPEEYTFKHYTWFSTDQDNISVGSDSNHYATVMEEKNGNDSNTPGAASLFSKMNMLKKKKNPYVSS